MNLHFKTWSAGLKTGLYSLKTRDASVAVPEKCRDTQTGIRTTRHHTTPLHHVSSSVIEKLSLPPVTTLMIDSSNDADNESESDETDMYASDDESAVSDKDAHGEDDTDYKEDTSSDIDQLMFDPVDFVAAALTNGDG